MDKFFNENNSISRKEIQMGMEGSIYSRIYLHKYYYPTHLQELIEQIVKNFDYFSCSVDRSVLTIKIKKTTMKKLNGYECTSSYFHTLVDNIIFDNIQQWLTGLTSVPEQVRVHLSDPYYIKLLYSITIISDNIVVIHF